MSRLDNAILRLKAQRTCLNQAAEAIAELSGPVFEVGLGNGRTFDHLRSLLPGREIFVFDRHIGAHPDSLPDEDHLFIGDFSETLPSAVERFGGTVALLHADIGSGYAERSKRSASLVAEHVMDLLQPGGLTLCDQDLGAAGLEALPLPGDIAPGRYHYYRRP